MDLVNENKLAEKLWMVVLEYYTQLLLCSCLFQTTRNANYVVKILLWNSILVGSDLLEFNLDCIDPDCWSLITDYVDWNIFNYLWVHIQNV